MEMEMEMEIKPFSQNTPDKSLTIDTNSQCSRKTPSMLSQFQLHSFHCQTPTSDYFTESTGNTTRLSDPKFQLLKRWQTLSGHISAKRMSWDAMIALNRHLDEMENVLLWIPQKQGKIVEHVEGLGISSIDGEQSLNVVGGTSPATSVSAKEDALEGAEQLASKAQESLDNLSLLERVTEVVQQLRQRQEELKVCFDCAR